MLLMGAVDTDFEYSISMFRESTLLFLFQQQTQVSQLFMRISLGIIADETVSSCPLLEM